MKFWKLFSVNLGLTASINLLFIINPINALCQPPYWNLAKEVKKVMTKIDYAISLFDKVETIGTTALTLKKEEEAKTKWQKIAQQFKESTEMLKNSKLPSQFNTLKYKFGIAEINCENKENILELCNGYLEKLKQSQITSYYFQRQLLSFIGRLKKAKIAIDEITNLYAKTPEFPRVTSQLIDLITEVNPELISLLAVSNNHLNKLKLEYKKVELMVDNLAGNIHYIENMKCGGLYYAIHLAFPKNTITNNKVPTCRWNFKIDDLNFIIKINKGEAFVDETILNYIVSYENIDCNDLVGLRTFSQSLSVIKKSIQNSVIYLQFGKSNRLLHSFSGTLLKNKIIGNLIIEPDDWITEDYKTSFRIIIPLSLTLKK